MPRQAGISRLSDSSIEQCGSIGDSTTEIIRWPRTHAKSLIWRFIRESSLRGRR